ncbi:MAG: hypothetical protein KA149_10855 [Chitinophagales bacterium]|nr:hypothetical protein [Chitinophagales bacterium]
MKKFLPPIKNNLFFYFTTLLFLAGALYFIFSYINYQIELKKIRERAISGIILESKKEYRGFHTIVIKDNVSHSTLTYMLPNSFFFNENNIQANDSVNKNAGSELMVFYKFKQGICTKCCEYEVSM